MTIICVGDCWAEEVRGEVLEFFKEQFLDFMESRPSLDEVLFPFLLRVDIRLLSYAFSPIEIDAIVADINGYKSPGLHVFNFPFYKKF